MKTRDSFSFFSTFCILILILSFTTPSLSFNRAACQSPNNKDIATNCAPNTVLVGRDQKFRTIQSAILSIPNDQTPYTVLVAPGTYTERINVTRSGPLTLLGITASPNTHAANAVTVLWKAATGTKETGSGDNAFTSTLTVAPNTDAALTGSGPTGHKVPAGTPFGNADFRAYNIDFVNHFKDTSAGPSLAVSVSYANSGFYYCGVRSYQDTVYIGKLGNAYFYGGEIAGQTDFLYGFGTAWIQSARLALRGCGGGITAWKGTNTTAVNKYGVYVHNSQIVKASSSLSIQGKCSLGRPWNELHRSIFAKCHLDDSIQASGYTKWSPNDNRINGRTLMGEFQDSGPGFNEGGRKSGKITKLLTEQEYEPYSTVEKVFQFPDGKFGNVAWIDRNPEAKGGLSATVVVRWNRS